MGGVQLGRGGVGQWGDECSVNGGDGGRLLFQSLFQYFTTLAENGRPSLAVARTLEYLDGVPS